MRVVLFDIDGTLVSTGGAGVKAFGEAFEAAFGIPNSTEKIKFSGRTDYSLFRELCHLNKVDFSVSNRELFFKHYLYFLSKKYLNIYKIQHCLNQL